MISCLTIMNSSGFFSSHALVRVFLSGFNGLIVNVSASGPKDQKNRWLKDIFKGTGIIIE